MPFCHLDKDKCKRDGICSAVCVTGIIKNDENRTPYVEEKNAYKCISCGLCVAYCPHEACFVENLDPSQFSFVDKNKMPSPEQVDLLIKTRRSVRNFRKDPVNDEILNKIMDNVRYAPSAKNTHNNRWIITRNREETIKVGNFIADFFLEISKNTENEKEALHYKLVHRAYTQGRDVITRGAPQLIVSVLPNDYHWKAEDGNIALTYFELASHGYGVGCVWAGYFTSAVRVYKPLQEFLGIKEDEYVAGAQFFGMPVYKTRQITSRHKNNITYI